MTVIASCSLLVVSLTRYEATGTRDTSAEVKSQLIGLIYSEVLYCEEEWEGEDDALAKDQSEGTYPIPFFSKSHWLLAADPLTASIAGKTICYRASSRDVYRALRL